MFDRPNTIRGNCFFLQLLATFCDDLLCLLQKFRIPSMFAFFRMMRARFQMNNYDR